MTIDDFASVDNMPENDLDGCETRESVSDIILRLDHVEYTDEVGNFYVMGMVDGKFGFYKYVNASYMPAHKAFLYIPRTTEGSSARAITFRFADDITDISIHNSKFIIHNYDDDDWYDLLGRKLSGKPTAPGMYINNGKKILIK